MTEGSSGEVTLNGTLIGARARPRVASELAAGKPGASGQPTPIVYDAAPEARPGVTRAEDEEAEIEADRLDALQVRLELLERDRGARLRELKADLVDREARLRDLEHERNTVLRESMEARARSEAAQRDAESSRLELRDARARCGELERAVSEKTNKTQQLQALLDRERDATRAATALAERLEAACSDAEQTRARLEAAIAELLDERTTIKDYVARAVGSRAWRIGHRLSSFARLITFRRNRGTSALGRLQERLERPPPELFGATASLSDGLTANQSHDQPTG